MKFRDRRDSGRQLAQALAPLRSQRPVVVALPRGGVPVAAEIASAISAPLDVLVVRKLGHPRQAELGVGAIGEGGVTVINWELVARLGVTADAVQQVAARERAELARRVVRYRGTRPRADIEGRVVVLVDDGLATGFTARAAVAVLRHAGARRVIIAVPVAPADTVEDLRAVADEVIALTVPRSFAAIGMWYEDFRQVGDDDVTRLLRDAALRVATAEDDEPTIDLRRGPLPHNPGHGGQIGRRSGSAGGQRGQRVEREPERPGGGSPGAGSPGGLGGAGGGGAGGGAGGAGAGDPADRRRDSGGGDPGSVARGGADAGATERRGVLLRRRAPGRWDRELDIEEIVVPAGRQLAGTLTVPDRAKGLVLFAHGAGSSRRSPRNRAIAKVLQRAGMATLLFDLLTEDEANERANVFDIALLAERLVAATMWSHDRVPELRGRVGYFGASTGAAAAMAAAAELPTAVRAVVSRGGRVDLAESQLPGVTAATLLIVGGNDERVLTLNRRAAPNLRRCDHHIAIVRGATHLFEEPGALQAVAGLTRDWFVRRLPGPDTGPGRELDRRRRSARAASRV